jgi:hypothetical protein
MLTQLLVDFYERNLLSNHRYFNQEFNPGVLHPSFQREQEIQDMLPRTSRGRSGLGSYRTLLDSISVPTDPGRLG